MVIASPYPSVHIPSVPLVSYLFDAFKHFGDKIALIQAETGRKVTYNELKSLVLLASKGLVEHNVQKGDFVAIVSTNLIEFCISFLSLVYIQAIPVLINPLLHVDEFVYHFSKFNPKMVMTTSAFLNKVEKSSNKVHSIHDIVLFDGVLPVPLKNEKKAIPFSSFINSNTQTADLPHPSLDIDPKKNPAVIVLSSGTTGIQKGVVLSHSNLISNIEQSKKAWENVVKENEVVSLNLPLFHIYGLTLVFLFNLKFGNTLVLIERFVLESYLEFLSKYKVTFTFVVPPIALLLVKTPLISKYDLSSLKTINSGAAPLDTDLQNEIKKKIGADVVQGYGLSETSPVTHVSHPSSPIGSVGLLLPNMEAKIVDPLTNKELSHDKLGELWLKGPNVMLGYYNDKESTDMAIDSEGFFHTGDIAKVDANGNFYIVDRIKDLIKFNAYQVAPAELEGLLLTHPLINDVAVVGKPDLKHGELPTAFVVKKAGSELTEKEIVEFVSQRTSSHKRLRGGVIFVDAIQKSPSGKILRRLMKQQMMDNMKRLQAKL